MPVQALCKHHRTWKGQRVLPEHPPCSHQLWPYGPQGPIHFLSASRDGLRATLFPFITPALTQKRCSAIRILSLIPSCISSFIAHLLCTCYAGCGFLPWDLPWETSRNRSDKYRDGGGMRGWGAGTHGKIWEESTGEGEWTEHQSLPEGSSKHRWLGLSPQASKSHF